MPAFLARHVEHSKRVDPIAQFQVPHAPSKRARAESDEDAADEAPVTRGAHIPSRSRPKSARARARVTARASTSRRGRAKQPAHLVDAVSVSSTPTPSVDVVVVVGGGGGATAVTPSATPLPAAAAAPPYTPRFWDRQTIEALRPVSSLIALAATPPRVPPPLSTAVATTLPHAPPSTAVEVMATIAPPSGSATRASLVDTAAGTAMRSVPPMTPSVAVAVAMPPRHVAPSTPPAQVNGNAIAPLSRSVSSAAVLRPLLLSTPPPPLPITASSTRMNGVDGTTAHHVHDDDDPSSPLPLPLLLPLPLPLPRCVPPGAAIGGEPRGLPIGGDAARCMIRVLRAVTGCGDLFHDWRLSGNRYTMERTMKTLEAAFASVHRVKPRLSDDVYTQAVLDMWLWRDRVSVVITDADIAIGGDLYNTLIASLERVAGQSATLAIPRTSYVHVMAVLLMLLEAGGSTNTGWSRRMAIMQRDTTPRLYLTLAVCCDRDGCAAFRAELPLLVRFCSFLRVRPVHAAPRCHQCADIINELSDGDDAVIVAAAALPDHESAVRFNVGAYLSYCDTVRSKKQRDWAVRRIIDLANAFSRTANEGELSFCVRACPIPDQQADASSEHGLVATTTTTTTTTPHALPAHVLGAAHTLGAGQMRDALGTFEKMHGALTFFDVMVDRGMLPERCALAHTLLSRVTASERFPATASEQSLTTTGRMNNADYMRAALGAREMVLGIADAMDSMSSTGDIPPEFAYTRNLLARLSDSERDPRHQ